MKLIVIYSPIPIDLGRITQDRWITYLNTFGTKLIVSISKVASLEGEIASIEINMAQFAPGPSMAQLTQRRTFLRRKINELSATARIPSDILIEIFQLACEPVNCATDWRSRQPASLLWEYLQTMARYRLVHTLTLVHHHLARFSKSSRCQNPVVTRRLVVKRKVGTAHYQTHCGGRTPIRSLCLWSNCADTDHQIWLLAYFWILPPTSPLNVTIF